MRLRSGSRTTRKPGSGTQGVINKLLAVDVVEAYSPPRVTLEAKKFGLKPGEAWDITTGWDSVGRTTRTKRRST